MSKLLVIVCFVVLAVYASEDKILMDGECSKEDVESCGKALIDRIESLCEPFHFTLKKDKCSSLPEKCCGGSGCSDCDIMEACCLGKLALWK